MGVMLHFYNCGNSLFVKVWMFLHQSYIYPLLENISVIVEPLFVHYHITLLLVLPPKHISKFPVLHYQKTMVIHPYPFLVVINQFSPGKCIVMLDTHTIYEYIYQKCKIPMDDRKEGRKYYTDAQGI